MKVLFASFAILTIQFATACVHPNSHRVPSPFVSWSAESPQEQRIDDIVSQVVSVFDEYRGQRKIPRIQQRELLSMARGLGFEASSMLDDQGIFLFRAVVPNQDAKMFVPQVCAEEVLRTSGAGISRLLFISDSWLQDFRQWDDAETAFAQSQDEIISYTDVECLEGISLKVFHGIVESEGPFSFNNVFIRGMEVKLELEFR